VKGSQLKIIIIIQALGKEHIRGKHMAYTRNKKSGIHHVSLRVPDLKKAVDFYIQGLDVFRATETNHRGCDGWQRERIVSFKKLNSRITQVQCTC
jgi:hypothetical protein